jgi:hypothetical protein
MKMRMASQNSITDYHRKGPGGAMGSSGYCFAKTRGAGAPRNKPSVLESSSRIARKNNGDNGFVSR